MWTKSLVNNYLDLQAFRQNEKGTKHTHLLGEKDQKLKGSKESKHLFTCRNSEGLLERGRNKYAYNINVHFQHLIQRTLTAVRDRKKIINLFSRWFSINVFSATYSQSLLAGNRQTQTNIFFKWVGWGN